jgi:hypothetical protein
MSAATNAAMAPIWEAALRTRTLAGVVIAFEARDKNFAGLLPFWDVLFGTYYMPRDRRPTVFGTATAVPQGLIGQLAFPFRRPGSFALIFPPDL